MILNIAVRSQVPVRSKLQQKKEQHKCSSIIIIHCKSAYTSSEPQAYNNIVPLSILLLLYNVFHVFYKI